MEEQTVLKKVTGSPEILNIGATSANVSHSIETYYKHSSLWFSMRVY